MSKRMRTSGQTGESEKRGSAAGGQRPLLIYWVAGIATYPSFFASIARQLEQGVRRQAVEQNERQNEWQLRGMPMPREENRQQSEGGLSVRTRLLYPYGDYQTSVWRQIVEIGSDLARGFDQVAAVKGGSRVRQEVLADLAAVEALKTVATAELPRVILIGHSGGGVAAYHAARLLHAAGSCRVERVILVGSPRVHIHPQDKQLVRYYYTWNDPVARIGGWLGMRKIGGRLRPGSYAPAHVQRGKLRGWHPDYFNQKELGGVSNASRMLDQLLRWLEE